MILFLYSILQQWGDLSKRKDLMAAVSYMRILLPSFTTSFLNTLQVKGFITAFALSSDKSWSLYSIWKDIELFSASH